MKYIILYISILGVGCNKFIADKPCSATVATDQVYFERSQDKSVFYFFGKTKLSKDTEIVAPKHFDITLPDNLKTYRYVNFQLFTFELQNHEYILLHMPECDYAYAQYDVTYNAEMEAVSDFVKLFSFSKKPNVNRKRRKHLFIENQGYKILLCNIRPENLEKYISLVKNINIRKQ